MRIYATARLAPCSQRPELAVRHSVPQPDRGVVWCESWAPEALLLNGRGATVELGHDGPVCGYVFQVVANREWLEAELVFEDTNEHFEAARERVHVGRAVSLDAQLLRRDDNLDLAIRRHTLARLKHVALLDDDQTPAYSQAKIVHVRTVGTRTTSPTSGVDWRTVLPAGYEAFADSAYEIEVGMELLRGHNRRGAQWDGQRFVVQHGHTKAA